MELSEVIKRVRKVVGRKVRGDTDGLIYKGSKDVKNIGVCWDLTFDNLDRMIRDKVNFIIVHTYPFLREFKPKLRWYAKYDKFDDPIRDIIVRNNISVFRAHLSWDDALQGNNYCLAKTLELKNTKKINFGVIGEINEQSLGKFSKFVKKKLGSKCFRVEGNLKSKISKVMVVAGIGLSFPELVCFCKKHADVLVSGDLTKNCLKFARTLNVNVIDAGAYETERPGLINLARILNAKFYEI